MAVAKFHVLLQQKTDTESFRLKNIKYQKNFFLYWDKLFLKTILNSIFMDL